MIEITPARCPRKIEAPCPACSLYNWSITPVDESEGWWNIWGFACKAGPSLVDHWTVQITTTCVQLWGTREEEDHLACLDLDAAKLTLKKYCLTKIPIIGLDPAMGFGEFPVGGMKVQVRCCLGCGGGCPKDSLPPSPDAPRLVTIGQGEQVQITVGGTDPDGDLVGVYVEDPRYGRFVSREERFGSSASYVDLTYEPPNPCWTGRDAFVFWVCDAQGHAAQGRVEIKVNRVYKPPQVSVTPEGTVDVRKGETVQFAFSVSDPDFDCGGDYIACFLKDKPSQGWVVGDLPVFISGPFTIKTTYRAAPNACGQDSFTVECVDRGRKTGQATAWVNIVNRPPQARPPELVGKTMVTLAPDGPKYGPVVMRAEIWDPDGDPVFVEAPGVPPQYARSLPVFLSSRVAVYFPYPEAEEVLAAEFWGQVWLGGEPWYLLGRRRLG